MAKHTCQQCGKEFHREPDKRGNRCKFCCMPCYRASRKGSTPWNKGKAWSEETKEKMRQAKLENPTKYWLGKTRSASVKLKISKALEGYNAGELCRFWKGGTTKENAKLRNSARYKRWRTQIFERDSYTCQECGQVGGKLNADHILPFATHKDNRFDLDNGRTLCFECHKQTASYLRYVKQEVCSG